MSTHRVPLYADTGGQIGSDSLATAGTLMERDPNGNSAANGLASGTAPTAAPTNSPYCANGGAQFQAGDTQTTTVTFTNASKRIQKMNAMGGAFTGTLPAASSSANQEFWFIKSDSSGNAVTIKGNGSDNITVGATTANTTSLATQGAVVRLWCDGTQWWAF